MKLINGDLHCHTTFSDGIYSVSVSLSVRSIALKNIEVLGVSDHYRYIKDSKKWEEYITICKEQKIQFDDVAVLVGTEIYFEDLVSDLDYLRTSGRLNDLDYIIIEYFEHHHPSDFLKTLHELRINFSEKLILLAHPDYPKWLSQCGSEKKFKQMLNSIIDLSITIEFNVNSGYHFVDMSTPFHEKFETGFIKLLREARGKEGREMSVVVSTDAHGYEQELWKRYTMVSDYINNSSTYKLLERAIQIAVKAHEGQLNKDGQPFILHPLRLMYRVSEPEEKIVSILHEVLNSDVTIGQLLEQGFPYSILEALDAITRREKEPYLEYIGRAAQNNLAKNILVKDIHDALYEQEKLKGLVPKNKFHEHKYKSALKALGVKSDAQDK